MHHPARLLLTHVLPMLVCASAILFSPRATAQCSNPWLPGDGVPGTNGAVSATKVWDPDGAGPAQPVLVVGGNFTVAGSVLANGIATHDPVTGIWSTLGSGGPTFVSALAVLGNGDLVAGSYGAVSRWNGSTWSTLGTLAGLNTLVSALTVLQNGDLVAGGQFAYADGQFVRSLARWNGTAWSPIGSGVGGPVLALATLPNGDLVVGGDFTDAGGIPASRIALWNGTTWSAMGGGMSAAVLSLLALPNGDLVAGGHFTMAGTVAAQHVARWNGASWSALAAGTNHRVFALAQLANGDLVAGGEYWGTGSGGASHVSLWNGVAWSGLGSGTTGSAVLSLTTLPNGDLVAGGRFGVGQAANLARWNGATWSALGRGLSSFVNACRTLPSGDLVVVGDFTGIGGVGAAHVARWNGTAWSAFGAGMSGAYHPEQPSHVYAVVEMPNGDLVAGGQFLAAGGVPANHIARWNGTGWSPLGAGISGPFPVVYSLAVLTNGDLVAGGQFTTAGGVPARNIARWDGTAWSPLGSGTSSNLPLTPGQVEALLVLPNGDLVACGGFNLAGGISANHIARWDGTTWSPFGAGTDAALYALATLPNGDLVAGGGMGMAGAVAAYGIARWNGAAWSAIGNGVAGVVRAVAALPNGDLVAGGTERAWRWNGAVWSSVGLGPSYSYGQPAVRALALRPDGDLVVGGAFLTAGGALSAFLATLSTTCPAQVVANGAGCPGSAGPNTLTATTLPWTGSTFRSQATGMPNSSLAIEVVGFASASTPLSSLLPQGVAGCTLHVTPIVSLFGVPSGNVLPRQIAIPRSAALAGVMLRQQVLAFELDAVGNVTAFTSTNALLLTIGSY